MRFLGHLLPLDTLLLSWYLASLGYRIWRPSDLAHTLAKGDNTYVDGCEIAARSRLSVM